MRTKKSFNNKAVFDEKYALYGDMLYKLGIIYFGPGNNNQTCQEAMVEAFLWLLTRKKEFKTPEEEKLELLRHMVLICESKSRRKSKTVPEEEKGMSEDALYSESIGMLEGIYGLPGKYKPVLHLALYEGLDIPCISKILYITRPIVKKLLVKGTELMEMVLERKLDCEYYHHMLEECWPSPEIKEAIYLYLTEGKPHVATYLSPWQKGKAALAAIAIAALCMGTIRLYPVLKSVINTKYAFMNGTIRSVTLNRIHENDTPGVLLAYSENGYQGYTLNGNSLEPLETKHITKTIDYAGQEFLADFYYCIKDGHLAVLDNNVRNDIAFASILPNDYVTEKILVTLCSHDNDGNSFYYPLIMDINTLETTDFISNCGISDFDYDINVDLNERLPRAIICTKNKDIYYLDINSSSSIKFANIGNDYLNSAYFYNDETIIYSIKPNEASVQSNVTSYYEYSINTNTVRKCYEYDSDNEIRYFGNADTVLLKKPDNTCSIVDISSWASTNIPNMQNVDELYLLPRFSPDERHILFEPHCNAPAINKIYIYDTRANETSILNLSDYKDVYFTYSFWYDNDHIALCKGDSTPISTDSSDPGAERPSTLWIFDINKLH